MSYCISDSGHVELQTLIWSIPHATHRLLSYPNQYDKSDIMTHFVDQHEAIPLLTPDFKHDLALDDSALLLSKSEFGVPKVEMKIVDRNFFL